MHSRKRTEQNRIILKSLVKCLEFCGRQGIALRGHRDDDTSSSFNKGNFKYLLDFRVDVGDTTLQYRMKNCKKNASYTSTIAQNDLLLCIKEMIQNVIVQEVKSQRIGAYNGFQCDDVSDASTWEQLRLVLRYTVNNKPMQRLLEFIPCESITGEALCQHIIGAGLGVRLCWSQTMYGAGNMIGRQKGCAAIFAKHTPRAVDHCCSSHDLALGKSCKLKKVHVMLESLKELGIFFKYE